MLTPVDIENKEFTKAFRGYDIYEVEEFMKSLMDDYEKLYRDNGELKEKNAVLTETIAGYKGMEETMQNAILVAQRTAEDIKQNAYERSETIIKDAERRAAEVVDKANRAINNLEKNYLLMQREMNGFKAKMSALLSTYMQLLNDLPEQPSVKEFDTAPIPVPVAAEPPKAVEEAMEDTAIYELPLINQAGSFEPELITPEQETPAVFEPERKLNPVVEELLKKKREEAKESAVVKPAEPKEEFSVTKETIQKDENVSSFNVDDLEDYDVFSDKEI